MKSLLIFSPYYAPHIGGLETHVSEFAQHLAPHDFDITIFTTRLGDEPLEEEQGKVHVLRYPTFEIVPSFPCPKFWHRDFRCQWQKIKKKDFDLQMTRTRFFITSLLPFFFGRQRSRWIHVEHGSDFVRQDWFISLTAWVWDQTLGRLIFNKCETLVAISENVKIFIRKFTARKDIPVIHRGMDFPPRPLPRPTDAIQQITFVGRLIDGKGVHDLLTAVSSVRVKQPFELHIIGDGPARSKLENQVKSLELDNVTFHGLLPKSKVYERLAQSLIFVNPSYTEGLPCSVLEAGFAGCAVIATNVGGTREIITSESDGFLIPTHSPRIIAEKIEYILRNPEEGITMGQNLQKFVISEFTWDKSIAKYLQILK